MTNYYRFEIGGMTYYWEGAEHLPSLRYTCFHCNCVTRSTVGFGMRTSSKSGFISAIYLCGGCGKPTFMDFMQIQIPYPPYGESIQELSKDVHDIYQEARNSYSAGAYTGVAHLCRTLLAHIAVEKNAEQGKSFKYYVTYLNDHHYLPKDTVDAVDLLRVIGNEATHELVITEKEDAEQILEITSLLLKNLYEFPNKSKRRKGQLPNT